MLKEFIEKGRKAKRINFPYTNKEEILKKLFLVNKNNELLNAGYILFAKEAKLEMQMAIFATETKLTFLDIDQVFENIFELIETGESKIDTKNVALKVKEKYPKLKKVYIDIIEIISKNNCITQEEIANELNKTRNSIYRNIKGLKDMGILERLGAKKNGNWKINI